MSDYAMRFWLQRLAGQLLPDERTAICLRQSAPAARHVLLSYMPGTVGSAFYRNLVACGRVWFCPCCSPKVTERRRIELSAALSGNAYMPLLVTFTLRHSLEQPLVPLLDALLDAYRSLVSGRFFNDFTVKWGLVGSIKALEVTRSVINGWHPHLHVLMLFDRFVSDSMRDDVEHVFKVAWMRKLSALGFDADYEHGVNATNSSDAIKEYIAKFGHMPRSDSWSVEHELVKAPSKLIGSGGLTPFQLLQDFGFGDLDAGRHFQEYAAAFKGRRQLRWSPRLRVLLGLDADKSDEELAAEVDPGSSLLAALTLDQWQWVLRNHAQGELCDQVVAHKGDPARVAEWLWDELAIRLDPAALALYQSVTDNALQPAT